MKSQVLYAGIVCITCIFTLLIFFDFREQWSNARIFRQATHNSPLSIRHLLVDPKHLKVKDWKVGESAVYQLKTNEESKQITFHVAAQDTRNENRFWLRTSGLVQFNEVDIELWRLLDNATLRLGSELRGFYFAHNAIPLSFQPITLSPDPLILEKLGEEVVETPIGNLISEHYFVFVRSPDAKLEPLLELWANPSVSPLGLVRARWQDASLDLVQVNTKAIPDIPPVLLTEFDKNTALEGSCARCHEENIGGKDLNLEFMNRLRAVAFNLTTALFHHRQAEIIKQNDLIHLRFADKSKYAKKDVLTRFSWNRGSFWVKPDVQGWIRVSMDTIAHQGNILVQPNIGHLILEIQ